MGVVSDSERLPIFYSLNQFEGLVLYEIFLLILRNFERLSIVHCPYSISKSQLKKGNNLLVFILKGIFICLGNALAFRENS